MSNQFWLEDCIRFRGAVLNGPCAHYCLDWDSLPVDAWCIEFKHCYCYPRDWWRWSRLINRLVQFQFERDCRKAHQKQLTTAQCAWYTSIQKGQNNVG